LSSHRNDTGRRLAAPDITARAGDVRTRRFPGLAEIYFAKAG
jgi:hypothetical protein